MFIIGNSAEQFCQPKCVRIWDQILIECEIIGFFNFSFGVGKAEKSIAAREGELFRVSILDHSAPCVWNQNAEI